MTKFWVSWYATDTDFEIHSPWWQSGFRASDDAPAIVAAVLADNEHAAKACIISSHDRPPADLEWRFCDERAPDWSPFGSRFPRADWMRWP